MTRKDYILIARALQRASEKSRGKRERLAGIWEATVELTVALGFDNGDFNLDHFLAVVRGEKALESRPAAQEEGHSSFNAWSSLG